ncbi:uncharacterized protein LOC108677419 [Hyalella azteca]|uniref:Uncharacterized protein LOC108677419 n=1 Tax=Hyalella azteca TaxID=294128 RepID=A0A8B7P5B1_HYAAZ|nr:uncharacterized protein LOC108677419 [Hyalella azteca]
MDTILVARTAAVLLLYCTATAALAILKDSSSHVITAVAGSPTVLPCPTEPLSRPRGSHHQESHNLILVFRDGLSAPVYSWDSRSSNGQDSDRCSKCPSEELKNRAYFWDKDVDLSREQVFAMSEHVSGWQHHVFQANFVSSPEPQSFPSNSTLPRDDLHNGSETEMEPWRPSETGLVLDPLQLSDAGDYICRVDFPRSPTRNTFVQLRVIEPMTSIAVKGFVTNILRDVSITSTITQNSTKTKQLPYVSNGAGSLLKPAFPEGIKILNKSASSSFNPSETANNFQLGSRVDNEVSVRSSDRKHESQAKKSTGSQKIPSPTVLGPYPVGTELLLQCEVIHGSPPPVLRWEDDKGSLIAASALTSGQRRSSISLRLASISLSDVGAYITCVAQNSPLTPVLRETVIIDVAVSTTSIRILAAKEKYISANASKASTSVKSNPEKFVHPLAMSAPKVASVTRDLDLTTLATVRINETSPPVVVFEVDEADEFILMCETAGSRPASPLLWTHGKGSPIDDKFITVTHLPGNSPSLTITKSVLRMRATALMHGELLHCSTVVASIEQPALHPNLTARIRLSVSYAPVVNLTSYSPLTSLSENSSLSLHCAVTAHPPINGHITLFRNNEVVHKWLSSGVNATENKTVTIRVTGEESSGYYSCSARNSVSNTISAPLHVRVNYAPRCAGSPHASYSTRGGEPLLVTCAVASQPRPSVFRWYVIPPNGSEPVEVNPSSHSDLGRSSTIQFVAPLHPPYPKLHCFADNSVGRMAEPCVIDIVPAEQPDPVQSCHVGPYVVADNEETSISVVCVAGRDGGLNQSFTLEVRPTRNPLARPPKALYHRPKPNFDVEGLSPNEEYIFTVTASNARGLSAPFILRYIVPLNEVRAFPSVILHEEITPVLLITFGAMATVITCSIVALLARWFCFKNKSCQVRHPRQRASFTPSNADYTRLQQYSNGSLARGGNTKMPILETSISHSRGMKSCCYADASSCSGDSISRSSCRSTTDTLLWTLPSDPESNLTFRNSGCYHIANLTPPDGVTLHHASRYVYPQRRDVLVTEVHALDSPRSLSRSSAYSTIFKSSSDDCNKSDADRFLDEIDNQSFKTRRCTISANSFNQKCACQTHSRPTTVSLPQRGSRLPVEEESCHTGLFRPNFCDAAEPSSGEHHFLSQSSGMEQEATSTESDCNTDSSNSPLLREISVNPSNIIEQTVGIEQDSCDYNDKSPNFETADSLVLTGKDEWNPEELSSDPNNSESSSEQSSRPPSSVSMATVALNPNFDLDQQLSESDS